MTDGHMHKVFWIPLKEGMLIWTESVIIKLKQWQKVLGSVDSVILNQQYVISISCRQ